MLGILGDLLQHRNLKKAFWFALALFVPAAIALAAVDAGLKTSATPYGIISFELCGFSSSCKAALAHWGPRGQALAMLSLGLDYLFLVLYPALICISLLLVVSSVPNSLKPITIVIAWSCVAIGLADAIENYALIQVILSESGSQYGLLGSIFATIKFVMLGLALLWLLFTSIRYSLFRRVDA